MSIRTQNIGCAYMHPGHCLRAKVAAACLAGLASVLAAGLALAGSPDSPEAIQGTSATAMRKSAVQAIPYDQLDVESRAKVNSVLSNVAIFRRLPIRMVACDPDLYLFLVRHPDVVVNIWEILGVAQLQLRQLDIDSYRIVETEGAVANLEYLYHSRDTQIIYGKWTYTGPLLSHKITGSCLAVLKTGYSKDSEGRYYVTSRLDGFLTVDSGGAELLARTLQPLVVKNIDNNFIQTVAFLGSMSKTAEVNVGGMQRLAERLSHVQPETRQQLSDVVASAARRAAARKDVSPQRVAARPPVDSDRQ